uniref:Uncharacterized protein MANES_08G036100 n=1 Tax=Rhizophora mucronata TaxID=61149 RepID=A0A2P2JUB8_RHIMU
MKKLLRDFEKVLLHQGLDHWQNWSQEWPFDDGWDEGKTLLFEIKNFILNGEHGTIG